MKLHSQINSKRDMTGKIRMTDCEPKHLQVVTEKLVNLIDDLLNKLDYQFPQYRTMTELDKILMVEYWKAYDGFCTINTNEFTEWFIKQATEPELIRRARQILIARHWIFVDPDVKERAEEAGHKFRQSVKSR